ncbi:alpha/beta fold hydrolase [Microbacterium sp. NPDC058062]|uniref:alpha/beta fold hydrolase n=1 Tax=Microbacterium sp. NPDC058062 TaxID=3346320 RepID=UPI0036DB29FB
MALLFLHGAGGYGEDRPLAEAIAVELGQPLKYPRFPDDDMSFDHQASPVRAALDAVSPEDLVAAHSFGASILLRVLAEREQETPRRVILLAMPDWSPQGWDVADYAFTGPALGQDISLHHCRDDDVVEFAHLALNSARLTRAAVHAYDSGGHQFDGLAPAIASDLSST